MSAERGTWNDDPGSTGWDPGGKSGNQGANRRWSHQRGTGGRWVPLEVVPGGRSRRPSGPLAPSCLSEHPGRVASLTFRLTFTLSASFHARPGSTPEHLMSTHALPPSPLRGLGFPLYLLRCYSGPHGRFEAWWRRTTGVRSAPVASRHAPRHCRQGASAAWSGCGHRGGCGTLGRSGSDRGLGRGVSVACGGSRCAGGSWAGGSCDPSRPRLRGAPVSPRGARWRRPTDRWRVFGCLRGRVGLLGISLAVRLRLVSGALPACV